MTVPVTFANASNQDLEVTNKSRPPRVSIRVADPSILKLEEAQAKYELIAGSRKIKNVDSAVPISINRRSLYGSLETTSCKLHLRPSHQPQPVILKANTNTNPTIVAARSAPIKHRRL